MTLVVGEPKQIASTVNLAELPIVVTRRDQPSRSGMPWRRVAVVLGILLIGCVGVLIAFFLHFNPKASSLSGADRPVDGEMGRPSPAGSDALSNPDETVVGLARLMPEGDLIRVAPPFGAGDARIAEILVSEGEAVQKSELLATLDNRISLMDAANAAAARVAQSEAALEKTKELVRVSALEAKAAVGEAAIAAQSARDKLDRAKILAGRGVTTTATLDELEAAASRAQQTLERARATLERWNVGELEQHPEISVARTALHAARVDLETAQNNQARSEVRAPAPGRVLRIDARPGERPSQNGLITLGRTHVMMALVEVFQTEIQKVEAGQVVHVSAPTLNRPLMGQVERIGLIIGRQNMISDDTAANTDARVVEILVRLDEESSERAASFSNLEAVARIHVAGRQ